MKKSLLLPVIFIVNFLIFSIFGSVCYMLACECFNFSAGTGVHFSNFQFLLKGLAYSIPISAIFSSVLVIFYTIKHDSNKWMNFVLYILICGIIYALILPASFQLSSVLNQKFQEDDKVYILSSGYFRPINDGNDGICFIRNTNSNGKSDGLLLKDGKMTVFYGKNASDFFSDTTSIVSIKDPLLEKSMEPKNIMKLIILLFKAILEVGEYSYRGRGIFLIGMISLALSLQSVYGYAKMSKWRLCNGCWVAGMFLIICACNLSIYISPLTDKFIAFSMSKEIPFLSDRNYLQIMMNGTFFIMNLIFGIVKSCKNPNANKQGEEQ